MTENDTDSNEPTPMTKVLQTGAAPLEAILEKTPKDTQDKLSRKLEEILKRSLEQMMSTFSDEQVATRLASARAVSSTGSLGMSDERMAIVNEHVKEMRKEVRQRTVVGSALTGSLGFLGQFADLPAFYLYALRCMGEVAISYGFDPRGEREQAFILELLRIGHQPGKRKRLAQLDELTVSASAEQSNLMSEASYALSGRGISVASKQIAALLIKRKLGAMVPLVGALVNAGFNWHLMGNILDTANRGYKSKAIHYRNRVNQDRVD